MKKYNIAVIPGDGIGAEVAAEAVKTLNFISELTGKISFNVTFYDWGCTYFLEHGKMMPDNALETLKDFDSILLGAVGFPGVPDHISLRDLLLKIRQGFDEHVNLRPVKLLNPWFSPLKKDHNIDMVFVRENCEGEYAGVGSFENIGLPNESALQTSVFTRKGCERIIRYAFNLAMEPERKRHVTSITKSNALNYSMVFWDKIFEEISREYPLVKTEKLHVDAAAMFMIQKPEKFDVVVASNLFGDILTDIGASLQGGLGFAAGANINPAKTSPSMFEPVHGSAPEIAGKNMANPIAMIWSCAMMLDFLGESYLADIVVSSLNKVSYKIELLTPDCGGNGTTESVGALIRDEIDTVWNRTTQQPAQ